MDEKWLAQVLDSRILGTFARQSGIFVVFEGMVGAKYSILQPGRSKLKQLLICTREHLKF